MTDKLKQSQTKFENSSLGTTKDMELMRQSMLKHGSKPNPKLAADAQRIAQKLGHK